MTGKKQRRRNRIARREPNRDTSGVDPAPPAAPKVLDNSAHTGSLLSKLALGTLSPPARHSEGLGSDSNEETILRADDYEAVADAVNHAGGLVRGLWISFVSVGTYLVIVVWSVTHKQLFLETPIKLPLIDVSIPLFGFFVVAPLFFLVMHAYLLLQLATLANRIERHEEVISSADPAIQSKLRLQLSSFVLIQFLLAHTENRNSLLNRMLTGVVWLTIVIGPLFFFLLSQWRFLPYQDQFVTWTHRLIIVADLAILWMFWPAIVTVNSRIIRPRRLHLSLAGVPTAAVGMLMLFVLTFPGEFIEQFPGVKRFHRWASWGTDASRSETYTGGSRPDSAAFVEGNDEHRGWFQRTSEARRWVAGTLKLVELDVVDDEALQKIEARAGALQPWQGERAFRLNGERNLLYADLISADLRRSDLRGANFGGANLAFAKLNGALLNSASFANAEMSGVDLRGASLVHASLLGAILISSNLNSAFLPMALAAGADLRAAHVQGAKLERAQLQGATLAWADLRGARLDDARLQGATFYGARLQGASLALAQLQGVNLELADLRGASLVGTQLQGASLTKANFDGALISGAFLYRTKVEETNIGMATVHDVDTGAVKPIRNEIVINLEISPGGILPRVEQTISSLMDDDVDDWIRQAVGHVPTDEHKNVKTQRLSRLKKGGATAEDDLAVSLFWKKAEASSAEDRNQSPEKYVQLISKLACSPEAAPHVARGLLDNNILSSTQHMASIAERMKARGDTTKRGASDTCPGVSGFTREDWASVDAGIYLMRTATTSPLTPNSFVGQKP